MSSTISTNMASLYAQRSLATAQADLATSVEKLSSGKRINRAKDDAAGLGISQSVMGVKNITDQSIRSTQNAISVVQAAEGARQVAGKVLQRILTLTTQKENTVLNDSQLSSIDSEITSLLDEIGKIKDRTRFQSGANSVFGVDISLVAGAGVAARNIPIQDLSIDDLGVSGIGGSKTVASSQLASLFNRPVNASGIAIPALQSFSSVVPNSVTGTTAAVSSSFVAATLSGGQSALAAVQSAKTAPSSGVQPGSAPLPVASIGASSGDLRFSINDFGKGISLLYKADPGSSIVGLTTGAVYKIPTGTSATTGSILGGDFAFQLQSLGGSLIGELGAIVGSDFSFQKVTSTSAFNPTNPSDVSGNIILGQFGFSDGTEVVIAAEGLVRGITNLQIGKIYHAQNVLDNGSSIGIQLKDPDSGNVINFDGTNADGSFTISKISAAPVSFTAADIGANRLNLTGTAFQVGDQVQYQNNGQNITGLSTGTYYVKTVSTSAGNDSITLATGSTAGATIGFGAITGSGTSSVTLLSRGGSAEADTITTSLSHAFENGDLIKYTTAGAIGGLSNNGSYYVRDVSGNSFKLASSSGGAAIDLLSAGSGTQTFTKGTIFTPSTMEYLEGDQVIYDGLTSNGTAAAGLTLGQTYTVHLVNGGNSFQLLDSSNSVITGATNVGQLFRKATQPTVAASDTITISNNAYQNGDAITYTSASAIGGLSTTSTYYVRDVSGNSFKLASTAGGAAINLTSSGSGTQTFSKGSVFGQPSSAFIEGAQIIYDGKQDVSGNNVTGLTVGSTYTVHLVNSGNSFQLLDSSNKVVGTSNIGTGAQLFSNASQPSIAQTDTITTSNNAYQNGDAITYTSASAIGGLSTTNTYYVRDVSGNNFKLASSVGGSAINLTSAGSGTQTFAKGTTFSQPSTAFTEGAQVVYSGTDASGNAITGLTVGSTYTVHLVNSGNSFQLLDATNKVANTSDVGTGTQIFSTPSSTLYLQGHGFSVGDQITYSGSSSGVGGDIGGLSRGTVYVVQAAPTSDTFQLATVASPSVALSLTSAGTGTQQFSGGSAMTASSIAAAIQTNARYTAELGAQINMLSYAVESMQTLSGNLAEAYSRIVDVDYAAETASLTRNQIMQEAATSMLAQANQTPNIILTLLS